MVDVTRRDGRRLGRRKGIVDEKHANDDLLGFIEERPNLHGSKPQI
jgi:hypothetical protein